MEPCVYSSIRLHGVQRGSFIVTIYIYILISRAGGGLPRRYSGRSVKLTLHPHLVPRLKTCGAMRPLLHTPSWRAEGQLYCNFPIQHQAIIIIIIIIITTTTKMEEAMGC